MYVQLLQQQLTYFLIFHFVHKVPNQELFSTIFSQIMIIALVVYKFIKQGQAYHIKVHVWGDINLKGPTDNIIFEGIIDACGLLRSLKLACFHLFVIISWESPAFARQKSKAPIQFSQATLKHGYMNWWQTMSEPPGLNPTQNLWRVLKEFI